MARSHTKSGPGRTHGQCQLIREPITGEHLGVKQPRRRFAMPNFGGNWKGKEYLSQREHDMLTRLTRLGPCPEFGVYSHLTREQALEIIKAKRF